jgi:hypothetical protein
MICPAPSHSEIQLELVEEELGSSKIIQGTSNWLAAGVDIQEAQ